MDYSYANRLCELITIENMDVVIVQDIIGAVPVTEQHEYVEISKATNTCASIHMRESDLESMRQMYPKVPVYGLWQTLVASEKVDIYTALQVVPTTHFDGYYVHSDVGRILYSGNYDAGFFAADTAFRLSNAVRINGDMSKLILPQKPAFLAKEILTNKRKMYRGHFLQCASLVFTMCIIALSFDVSLALYSEQGFASIVEKDNTLKKMRNNFKTLSKNRLIEIPDQSEELKRLALIFNDFNDIKITSEINLKKIKVKLSVKSIEDPALLYSFIVSEIQPDGRWSLMVKLKG